MGLINYAMKLHHRNTQRGCRWVFGSGVVDFLLWGLRVYQRGTVGGDSSSEGRGRGGSLPFAGSGNSGTGGSSESVAGRGSCVNIFQSPWKFCPTMRLTTPGSRACTVIFNELS